MQWLPVSLYQPATSTKSYVPISSLFILSLSLFISRGRFPAYRSQPPDSKLLSGEDEFEVRLRRDVRDTRRRRVVSKAGSIGRDEIGGARRRPRGGGILIEPDEPARHAGAPPELTISAAAVPCSGRTADAEENVGNVRRTGGRHGRGGGKKHSIFDLEVLIYSFSS